MKRFLKAFIVVATLIMVSGCVGAVNHKSDFSTDFSPNANMKVDVSEVTNETGNSYDVNIEELLTDALVTELENAELLASDGSEKISLKAKIVEYEKGNAFKRWLLPGWGATAVTTHCELFSGNKLIGSVEARRTVSAGGGYSVGAWRTIFSIVSKDIIAEIKTKI